MGTIVDLFRRYGREPFEALLAPHIERMYRLAYRFTGNRDDAEDLVQELLAKIYPRRKELVKIEHLGAWLARTLYNHFIDATRRESRTPLADSTDSSLLDELEAEADPERDVDTLWTRERLAKALTQLNPQQRALVTMHDVEGYSLPELVTVLETPIGTLKSRLHRSRARLREILSVEPNQVERRYSQQGD